MSLFVDKHRPKNLDSLDYHTELSGRLKSLVANDFPHTLFYGPSGAGKKTRISCCLRELYGAGAEKLKIEQRTFLTPSKRKLDVNIVQSNYHMEITPSDLGHWDRFVIQDILKEIAQTQQIDLNAKQRFKIVVINDADHLSRDAQAALRRTMEKYTVNLRLILCANSTSRIIPPIKSRCLLIRVGAPSEEQIATIIQKVATAEDIMVPDTVALTVSKSANGNLRRALLSFEALHVKDPTLSESTPQVILPDWETYSYSVADLILSQQTPQQLLSIREMLYELLVHCIPPDLILKTITSRLLKKVDDQIKGDIVDQSAFYEHRLCQGTKPIFHLEAYVAKIMSVYKAYLLNLA